LPPRPSDPPPAPQPPAMHSSGMDAWSGFLRTHALLWREMESRLEAKHGLSLSCYEVLVLLDEAPRGQLRMAQLSSAVLMSTSGFTRLADRLERRGLIRRERCADDARGYEVKLTDVGRAQLNSARATHETDIHEQFVGRLTADEQSVLAALWRRLRQPAPDRQPGASGRANGGRRASVGLSQPDTKLRPSQR
jgi:DNA-binding MarR family transcriptional regulator